mgnify:CR=1 FL=1
MFFSLTTVNTLVHPKAATFQVRVANLSDDIWFDCNPEPKLELCILWQNWKQMLGSTESLLMKRWLSKKAIWSVLLTMLSAQLTWQELTLNQSRKPNLMHCWKWTQLGYTKTVKHQIKTEDDILVTQPYRRIPPNLYQEVKAARHNGDERKPQSLCLTSCFGQEEMRILIPVRSL